MNNVILNVMNVSRCFLTSIFCLCLINLIFANEAKASVLNDPIEKSNIGPPFSFSIPPMISVEPGWQVCIDVRTGNFENVLAFQYGIKFDPTVLRYNGATSDIFEPLHFLAGLPSTGESIITIGWASLEYVPLTLADNTVIYSLCFTAIGNSKECTGLEFGLQAGGAGGAVIALETTEGAFYEEDIIFNNGLACVEQIDNTLAVEVTKVDPFCEELFSGSIQFEIAQGVLPYEALVSNCSNGSIVFGPQTFTGNAEINQLDAGDYCIEIIDSNEPANNFTTIITLYEGSVPIVIGYDSVSVSAPNTFDGVLEILLEANNSEIASYKWEEELSGTTYSGNPITGLGGGTYNVTLTDQEGCTTTSSVDLYSPIPEPNATIDFSELNDFSVFPNPSFDGKFKVHLEASIHGSYQVSITNILGKQIKVFSGVKSNNFLDFQLNDPGCYIINLLIEGQPIISKKLILNI